MIDWIKQIWFYYWPWTAGNRMYRCIGKVFGKKKGLEYVNSLDRILDRNIHDTLEPALNQ